MSQSGLSQTSATSSKKRATEESRQQKQLIDDIEFAARLLQDNSLQQDKLYIAELDKVCKKYDVTLEECIRATLEGWNCLLQCDKLKTETKEEPEPQN